MTRNVLEAIPLPLYGAIIRRDVLVFLYHVVGPPDLPHIRHLYPYKSPEAFERDLIYLANRYRIVSYEEMTSGLDRSRRPAAHITFDDGYAECESLARPILLRRGIPCTFFLTTDFIDNRAMFHRNKASLCIEAAVGLSDRQAPAFLRDLGRRLGRSFTDLEAWRRWILSLPQHDEARIDEVCALLQIGVAGYLRQRRPYLTTEQIRRIAADGFTIGAHARRHVPLGSLSESGAEEEIVTSCRTIRGLTGRDQVPFAFPHSADGVDRAFLRSLIARHAFIGRLFDTHRLRRENGIIVNRITADAPPATPHTTNLPHLLRAAYKEEASDALGRFIAAGLRRRPPGQKARGAGLG